MTINAQSKVWEGVFQSFSEVAYEQNVFAESTWLEKMLARATALREEARGRDALFKTATTADYALPVVAATTAKAGATLRILDFGGGLGLSYIPLKSMLRRDQSVKFVIVENDAICRLGRSMFAGDEDVSFCSTVPAGDTFDIVHAGSSIHYVDQWQSTIQAFADTGAEYVLFADLPAGDVETFVTAQWFHGRRVPVRFWNLGEFSAAVENTGFELIFKSAYSGPYLERNASLPTSHFDRRHRLEHFCQLVFRRRAGSGE